MVSLDRRVTLLRDLHPAQASNGPFCMMTERAVTLYPSTQSFLSSNSHSDFPLRTATPPQKRFHPKTREDNSTSPSTHLTRNRRLHKTFPFKTSTVARVVPPHHTAFKIRQSAGTDPDRSTVPRCPPSPRNGHNFYLPTRRHCWASHRLRPENHRPDATPPP